MVVDVFALEIGVNFALVKTYTSSGSYCRVRNSRLTVIVAGWLAITCFPDFDIGLCLEIIIPD